MPSPRTLLQTERLVLREFVDEDVELLVELDSDPRVVQFVRLSEPTTSDRALEMIIRLRSYPWDSQRGFWAAEVEGAFIGWFHLRPNRETGVCELGYRLAHRFWACGYATEGGRALLSLGFETGEPEVVAQALAANRASTRVMEKLGMHERRRFLYEELEAVEYGIDREAFLAA